jgi:hypothetical protein
MQSLERTTIDLIDRITLILYVLIISFIKHGVYELLLRS